MPLLRLNYPAGPKRGLLPLWSGPWHSLLVPPLLLALTLLFYWKIALSGRILVDYDLFAYFYPYKAYAAQALREGRLPFWNPYLFMGVPFLANIQSAFFYPFNWVGLFLEPPQATNLSILVHVFLVGAFMFAFARISVGLDPLGALMAAISFMFSGYLTQQVGHINQLNALTWLPLLLLLLDLAHRRTSLPFLLLGGAVLGLQFLAGHTQVSYLTVMGLSLYALFLGIRAALDLRPQSGGSRQLWRNPRGLYPLIKVAFLLLAMLGLGLGLAAFQLLPTYELSQQSIRGGGLTYGEAASFSLPPWLLLSALLPSFLESPFSEFTAYVGFLPLILAARALLARRSEPYTRFSLALALLALFLALGGFNPLYPWIYRFLPGIAYFRVPARWLSLYIFAISTMAGIGMSSLVSTAKRIGNRRALRPLGLWRGYFGAVLLGILIPNLALAAYFLLLWPRWEVIVLWVLVGGLSLALVQVAARAPRPRLNLAIIALAALELFLAGRSLDHNRPVNSQAYTSLRPALAQLLLDQDLYRILSLASSHFEPGDTAEIRAMLKDQLPPEGIEDFLASTKYKEIVTPNLSLRYGIASIDGYDGGLLPLERYGLFKQLLLESGGVTKVPPTDPAQADALLRNQLADIPNTRLLGVLNVRYILIDKIDDPWVDGVYYDLADTLQIGEGSPASIEPLPSFAATALGLVSHLNGGRTIPTNTPVALVSIEDATGDVITATLRAGIDTAEGSYPPQPGAVAHEMTRVASPSRRDPGTLNYYTKIAFGRALYPKAVRVEYLADPGELLLRGLSLIDERTGASEAIVLNPRLKLVNSGDIKIYENLDWLPRAFAVHEFQVAQGNEETMAALRDDLGRKVVLEKPPPGEGQALSGRWALAGGSPSPRDEMRILYYRPEEVRLRADLAAPGFVVLTDSYYPGWRAWVDGQEVEILAADHLFRAVYLPPGKHILEFRYTSSSFAAGLLITQLTLGLALALVLAQGLARVLLRTLRLSLRRLPHPGGFASGRGGGQDR